MPSSYNMLNNQTALGITNDLTKHLKKQAGKMQKKKNLKQAVCNGNSDNAFSYFAHLTMI